MRTCVNAFHVKAHELKCQIKHSPKRQHGLGESDGEGTERDWDSKRHLVPAGRSSSPAARLQMLSSQSQHYAHRLRIRLPILLETRYRRARTNLAYYTQRLAELRDQASLQDHKDGEIDIIAIRSNSELAQLAQEQVKYFETKQEIATKEADHINIYLLISKQEDTEREIAKSAAVFRPALQTKLNECNLKLSSLLAKYRYNRTDWGKETNLRAEWHRRNGNEKIYNAIKKVAESKIKSGGVFTRKQNKLYELLGEYNYSSSEWDPEDPESRYGLYEKETTLKNLEETLKSIFGFVYARSVELRLLKKGISGQKETNILQEAVTKRSQLVSEQLERFNTLVRSLPEGDRIELSLDMFQTPSTSNSDQEGALERVLWKFQQLKDRFMKSHRLLNWLQQRSIAFELFSRLKINNRKLIITCWDDYCTILHLQQAKNLRDVYSQDDQNAIQGCTSILVQILKPIHSTLFPDSNAIPEFSSSLDLSLNSSEDEGSETFSDDDIQEFYDCDLIDDAAWAQLELLY
ncbi:hypothetical protein TWF694_008344 [Orbilia ellipsospora]|uniref:Uncharacterized protein n=1 Tax=Orbilia ellipsospora TaxID=2528407 RepID=A0AAV9XMG8_9PEZI